MKTILTILILMVGLSFTPPFGSWVTASSVTGLETATLASTSTATSATAGDVQIAFEQTNVGTGVPGNFFLQNWGSLAMGLLAFFDVVARLTPTTKDNSIVNLLTTVINAIIPNFKKGGGRF